MTYTMDLHQLNRVLDYVSAECDRDQWVRHLMAIKSEFGETAREIAQSWSATANNFKLKDFLTTWKSIKSSGGVTIASLVYEAKQNGYTPEPITKEKRQQLQQQQAHRRAEQQRQEAIIKAKELSQHRQAAKQAQTIIQHASPAPDDHPYLIAKGIDPHGVLFGSFLKYQDNLVIPIYGTVGEFEGKAQSIQFIAPDGSKNLLKGAKKSGGYYPIQWVEDAPIVICEGFATGCTLAEHYTPMASVIMAIDSGNLIHVARYFRKHYPTAEITIAGDNDHQAERKTGINTGKQKAIATAKAIRGRLAIPEFKPNESGTDWNDRYNLDQGGMK